MAVVRYNDNGSVDGTFSGGKQIVDVYGGTDNQFGLALQPDGKVLIIGSAYSSDNTVHDLALVRFNADGSRDAFFGLLGNGIVTADLYGTGSSYGYDVAISPLDGKILAAGTAYAASGIPGDLVVARYLP
jgi:uncharacterized delta-60 repeat protein